MDLAEISLDLKNFARKCYVSWSVWISLGFGEKIQDRTNQIRFWTKGPATNRWSSQVSQQSAQFRSGLPGELGHRLNWTPLSEIGTQTIIHNQQETQVRRHVFGIQINRQYKRYSMLQTFKDHDGLVHIAQLFFSHLRPITLMKITTRIKIPCYL